jgi:hypothetical protein
MSFFAVRKAPQSDSYATPSPRTATLVSSSSMGGTRTLTIARTPMSDEDEKRFVDAMAAIAIHDKNIAIHDKNIAIAEAQKVEALKGIAQADADKASAQELRKKGQAQCAAAQVKRAVAETQLAAAKEQLVEAAALIQEGQALQIAAQAKIDESKNTLTQQIDQLAKMVEAASRKYQNNPAVEAMRVKFAQVKAQLPEDVVELAALYNQLRGDVQILRAQLK